jgi:hypothetical protein
MHHVCFTILIYNDARSTNHEIITLSTKEIVSLFYLSSPKETVTKYTGDTGKWHSTKACYASYWGDIPGGKGDQSV